jgi:hypothetical protein
MVFRKIYIFLTFFFFWINQAFTFSWEHIFFDDLKNFSINLPLEVYTFTSTWEVINYTNQLIMINENLVQITYILIFLLFW